MDTVCARKEFYHLAEPHPNNALEFPFALGAKKENTVLYLVQSSQGHALDSSIPKNRVET